MMRIPGFRCRIVPAFLCGFFGAAIAIGSLGRIGMMAFAYHRYGLFPVRPDTPSLNLFAISMRNVASVTASILAGAARLWLDVRMWPGWRRREIAR